MIQVSETYLHEAVVKKDEGNKFFVEKNYAEAIRCYTEAIGTSIRIRNRHQSQ